MYVQNTSPVNSKSCWGVLLKWVRKRVPRGLGYGPHPLLPPFTYYLYNSCYRVILSKYIQLFKANTKSVFMLIINTPPPDMLADRAVGGWNTMNLGETGPLL
jgi:hypothetical protein